MQMRKSSSASLLSLRSTRESTDVNENFKVAVRVRPPLQREMQENGTFDNTIRVDPSHKALLIAESFTSQEDYLNNQHHFTFDMVYDQNSRQSDIYTNTARDAVLSTLEGYNATIIAYGQTGTGKTYTMEGFTSEEDKRGIIPRATEEIFNYIQTTGNPKTKFLVRASYLQIYNDVISDLLKPERTNLTIREDKKRGVYVENLSEWVVRSPAEIYNLMNRGSNIRKTGRTNLNPISSRSHAVFIIIVEQNEQCAIDTQGNELDMDEYRNIVAETGRFSGELRESFRIGKLNLVDLAGSERVRLSGATGVRLDESKKINQSLSTLGNVIAALTEGKPHIPYRDSKLTRLLEDSLGGNCRTTMLAMVSPALEAFLESLSTLKFANRAKSIKNQAHVNEDLDQRALLRRYEKELKKLRSELEKKTKNVVDKKRIMELEQEKKAAISALTQKTEEFLREQQKKRDLENRIAMMQSQLLVGGEKIQETPMFKNLVKQEHERVHRIYEKKLQDLEKERQSIEQDKAQVDRYKQLLLKQRDIMIALTARLNERDEYIHNLQEELDAYDRHQKMLEDTVNQKTEIILQYENAMANGENLQLSHSIPRPLGEQSTNYEEDNRILASTIQQLNDKLRKSFEENERYSVQIHQNQEEILRLKQKLSSMNQSTDYSSTRESGQNEQSSAIIDKQQIQVLKQQCITKEKEKQALKTILETRVAPELSKIYVQIGNLTNKQNKDTVDQLKGTLSDLSELLNASIAAIAIRKPVQNTHDHQTRNPPSNGSSSSTSNSHYTPQLFPAYQSGYMSSSSTNSRF